MAYDTAKLGGAASDVVIARVAVSHAILSFSAFYSPHLAWCPQHGLMMMTWKPTAVTDEEAFAAIKAGMDALPPGVKMYFHSSGYQCGALSGPKASSF